jgi:Putative adhesin
MNRRYSSLGGAFLGGMLALFLAVSANAQVSQEFHRTVSLPSNGRVSLDNVNGNVEIAGWDRNEVQIDAEKKGRDQQRLDEAQIEVEAGSDYVKIHTQYPHNHTNNNPASVHYTLHVPQNAQLDHISLVNGALTVQKVMGEVDASLVNGKAHISDLSGETSISSVNGSIEANYASLSNVREIRLKSVNGSIELGLPASPNADVKASTVNGGIKSDFPLTVQGSFAGHNVTGTLGSGGTRIDLSNVNGSIHIGSAH